MTLHLPADFQPDPGEGATARVLWGLLMTGVVVATMALLTVGLRPALGPGTITYRLDGTTLVITPGSVFSGAPRVVPRSAIVGSRRAVASGGRREMGTGMPGYCLGRFRYDTLGSVWMATNCSCQVLALDLRDGSTIVLTPPDRDAFADALRDGQPLEVVGARVDRTVPRLFATWVLPALTLGVAFVVLLSALVAPGRLRYRVEPGWLVVRTLFRTRRFPTGGMRARRHRPTIGRRIYGTAMPGYRAGWFYVDGERGLVFATAAEGVLLEGSDRVFLTPASPHAFLEALRQAGATTA
jgi:hypothetical protein